MPDSAQHPIPTTAVLSFVVIAFGLAWGIMAGFVAYPDAITALFGPISGHHPLFILAVYAPAIAAITLVLIHAGAGGLRRYLGRLLIWRAPAAWYLFLIAGIPLIYIAGSAIKGNLGAWTLPADTLPSALAALALTLIIGPVEELGWRGFALPLLQRVMPPIAAGLVLGIIWGLWHLPAFFLSGTPQSAWDFTPFLIGSVAISLILTPLFNASGGSILLAALFHFQLNNPFWPDAQPHDTWIFAAVALGVTWLNRRSLFTRTDAVRAVVPPIPHATLTES